MFDFLALAILRQFVASGTLSLKLADGSMHRLQGGMPGPAATITTRWRAEHCAWSSCSSPATAAGAGCRLESSEIVLSSSISIPHHHGLPSASTTTVCTQPQATAMF